MDPIGRMEHLPSGMYVPRPDDRRGRAAPNVLILASAFSCSAVMILSPESHRSPTPGFTPAKQGSMSRPMPDKSRSARQSLAEPTARAPSRCAISAGRFTSTQTDRILLPLEPPLDGND